MSALTNGILGPRPYPILNTPGLVLLHDYKRNLDVLNNCPATNKLTLTRATARTAIRGDGLLQSFASGAFAINDRGLWVDPLGTNIFRDSGNIQDSSAYWAVGSASAQNDDTITPLGSLLPLIKLEEANTSSASRVIRQTAAAGGWSLGASTAYVHSVFARAAERNIFTMLSLDAANYSSMHFDLATGTYLQGGTSRGSGGGMQYIGNGVYRCWMNFTSHSSPSGSYMDYRMSDDTVLGGVGSSGDTYTGVVGNGMYFGGAQLETGSVPTSYIPTTSGAGVRNVDDMVFTSPTFINATEGTLIAIGRSNDDSQSNGMFSLDDGTANERIQLIMNTATGGISVSDGGVTQAAVNPSVDVTARHIVAGRYKANDFQVAIDGALGTPDTSGTIPTVTVARVGGGAGLSAWSGNIEVLAYINRAVSDGELRFLSSAANWGL